jgi:hypothetical protein
MSGRKMNVKDFQAVLESVDTQFIEILPQFIDE